jgi:hypothetical protein
MVNNEDQQKVFSWMEFSRFEKLNLFLQLLMPLISSFHHKCKKNILLENNKNNNNNKRNDVNSFNNKYHRISISHDLLIINIQYHMIYL